MKGKLLIKILSFTAISTFVVMACKPEPNVPLTEKYVSASENFKVLDFKTNLSASNPIDFTKDTLKFTASLNEEVSWKIIIKGLSDPKEYAVKTLKGTGSNLDSALVFWTGESDNIYFFRRDEKLDIQVSFLGSKESVSFDGFQINSLRKFSKSETILFVDFEPENSVALASSPDAANTFFDTENKNEELDQFKFSSREGFPRPVEGYGMVYLKGKDLVSEPSSFYIGGVKTSDIFVGFKDKTPLDEVYLNFYVNSNGNKTTKIVVLLPGVGGDEFKIERTVTWNGWKLISAKLSDFILFNAGALGTSKMNLNAVKNVNIQIHSAYAPGNTAEALIDFVCFTYGGPFSQSK